MVIFAVLRNVIPVIIYNNSDYIIAVFPINGNIVSTIIIFVSSLILCEDFEMYISEKFKILIPFCLWIAVDMAMVAIAAMLVSYGEVRLAGSAEDVSSEGDKGGE